MMLTCMPPMQRAASAGSDAGPACIPLFSTPHRTDAGGSYTGNSIHQDYVAHTIVWCEHLLASHFWSIAPSV